MRFVLPLAIALALSPVPAHSQERNGYADLVRATEVLRTSKLFPKAGQGEGATLAYQRAVLEEKAVREALRLLRAGLSTPVTPPMEGAPEQSVPREMRYFRELGRLLQLHGYVLLADGMTGEALENARLGFALAKAIRTDSLLSAVVGTGIENRMIAMLANRLGQLGSRDCEAVLQLYRTRLSPLDPLLARSESLRRESYQALQATLAQMRMDGRKAIETLAELFELEAGELDSLLRQLPRNDSEILRLHAECSARIERYYATLRTELGKPYWKRDASLLEGPEPDGTLAGQVVASLCGYLELFSDSFTDALARLRLLACHAAVLRYRWEYDRLPPSLETLQLGAAAEDPFVGMPFRYEVEGKRYRLYSQGPKTYEDDPLASGGRRPVSIVPGEP